MFFNWKIRFLKTRRGNYWWRCLKGWQGKEVGNYNRLDEYIRQYAPGKSFVDVGCMWGVDGKFAFLAEEVGSTLVKAVDLMAPTPEFESKKRAQNSAVQFKLGDVSQAETLNWIGPIDVVFCAGVLYHHPSPFDLLVALRQICTQTLILRSSTIPEINGLPNAAVYFPMLKAQDRKLWNLASLGVGKQVGITAEFEPKQGYGNWFWGLSPSCLASLLETAGFQIDHQATEAFAQTVICSPIHVPFSHSLPG